MSNTSEKQYAHSLIRLLGNHQAAVMTGACLIFIILAKLVGLYDWSNLQIFFFVMAYVVGGYQKAWEGLQTLFVERDLDVDLLMVVAAIGAAAIGYWMDGAILIFIFSLSGALEGYTMERTNRDIKALIALRPQQAVVLEGSLEMKVNVEQLKVGQVVVVRPGEKIAADGTVMSGGTSVNESSITGEYLPIDKEEGSRVYAGTINGQGAIHVRVDRPSEETNLAKIIRLVQEAQDEKPPSQQFVEKFEGIYAKVIVIVAFLLIIIPPYFLDWTWQQTIYRAMIFLVVASPCALVASIMPAILSGISNAARNGVLFKGGAHLQNIGDVKVVAFDKTGTLTIGQPQLMDIAPLNGESEDELLALAASVELLSEHPIARAIIREAEGRKLVLRRPTALQALHGMGVRANIDSDEYIMGKRDVIAGLSLSGEQIKQVELLESQGKTVIYLASNCKLIGMLAIQDRIRNWTAKIVSDLKGMGVKVAMLTGDTQTTAMAIASQAGIDMVYAGLMPDEKVAVIKELEAKFGKVAMVGDGVNDAPALASASVGLAIGSGGTDVATETADIILIKDNIENIPFAINLGRRSRRVITQNIVFAIAVALILITLNFVGGSIGLPEGVIGHEGSTVLVIISGLRLLR